MDEREQRWKELEAEMQCPLTLNPCRKVEELRRIEKFLSHSAVIFTVECKRFGIQVSGWGQR